MCHVFLLEKLRELYFFFQLPEKSFPARLARTRQQTPASSLYSGARSSADGQQPHTALQVVVPQQCLALSITAEEH